MNNANAQQQLNKCSNTKENQKKCLNTKENQNKSTIVAGKDVKVVQPKQKNISNEKSFDDTLKNVDELPEDDESIRNAIEHRK